jgi:hypothetical protein
LPHVHYHIDSTLRLLWGCMDGQIADKRGWVTFPEDFMRPFHIPAGVKHSATMGSFTVFINWEKWISSIPVTSAADDFTAV